MTRTGMAVAALIALAAAPPARGAEDGAEAFASLDAPKGADWKNPERWRDVTRDGKAGVELTANTSYAALPVAGEVPEARSVMFRVTYHSYPGLRPFRIAVGAWGSPTKFITPEGDGWQTGEAAFDMAVVRKFLSGGKVHTMISGDKGGMPILARLELYVPSAAHVMEQFRAYVRASTEKARSDAKKLSYVGQYDDKTPLAPSPGDAARGAIPFARSYLIPMYPASVPTAKERRLEIDARMAMNEYEPVQIGVKALKDLADCSARVLGRLPEGLAAEVRWMECVPLRTAGGSSSKKWHLQPNRLWPKEVFPNVTVKKGGAQAWWVTFRTGKGVRPGVHPVKVAVESSGTEILRFTVNLRVLPFELPEKVDYAWGFYTPREVPDTVVKDMVRHGCNSLSAWPTFKPWIGNKVDFSAWDPYFEMLKENGISHSFLWYVGTKDGGYPVRDAMKDSGVIAALKGIEERVKDGRYPKHFYVTIDEACRNGARFNDMKGLFRQVKEHAPALGRFGVSLNRHRDAVRHEGMIDCLSCNGDFGQNGPWCKRNGYGMYTYTVFSGRTTSKNGRYNCGFNPWRYGATGTYGWALMWYNGDPYNDCDSWGSDWGIVLPNWTGRPIATPGWEGWREGVDDRRYIALYEQLAAEGRAPKALLDELRTFLKEHKLSNEEKVGDSIFEASLGDALKLVTARDRLIDGILKATGRR